MAYTVLNVLLDAGGIVDQDASTTPTSTELTNQISYADSAQRDWFNFYNWPELRYSQSVSGIQLSQTSIGLPTRFDHLSSAVWDYSTGVGSPAKYVELNKPDDRFYKLTTDKYVYLVGNQLDGMAMVINPALASGASLVFDYQAFPSSLATLTDNVTCPNRSFMTTRVQYYRLLARSDDRFPLLKADSEQIVANEIEKHDIPSGGQNNKVPTFYDRTSFRIGG